MKTMAMSAISLTIFFSYSFHICFLVIVVFTVFLIFLASTPGGYLSVIHTSLPSP